MVKIDRILELSKLTLSPAEKKSFEEDLDEMIFFVDRVRNPGPSPSVTLIKDESSSADCFRFEQISEKENIDLNSFIGDYDLTGDPISVKDNILVKGMPCTAGSKMLSGFIAPYDSPSVAKLRAAGFKIAGKTNMDEFAMGGASLTGFTGPVINPLYPDRIVGGSSGGAAAGVCAGLVRWALGSDTGGSLRQPAAYLGLTCLKPTYGNVSRHGLIAYASSFDQIGPVARTPSDVKHVFEIINEGRYKNELPSGYRLLLPNNLISMSEDHDAIYRATGLMGANEVFRFDMPCTDEILACYYIIACAEASSNLGRYDSDRYMSRDEGFGYEVKKRICLGNFVLSEGFYDEYYMKAVKVAEGLKVLIDGTLTDDSVIMMPVTKGRAPLLSEYGGLRRYTDDIFTVYANILGLPSVCFPIGVREDGSPIGIQLMGSRGSEELLLKIALKAGGYDHV